MRRLTFLLLLLSASSAVEHARGGVCLEGTFIQYQVWMTNLNREFIPASQPSGSYQLVPLSR